MRAVSIPTRATDEVENGEVFAIAVCQAGGCFHSERAEALPDSYSELQHVSSHRVESVTYRSSQNAVSGDPSMHESTQEENPNGNWERAAIANASSATRWLVRGNIAKRTSDWQQWQVRCVGRIACQFAGIYARRGVAMT